MIAIVTGGSGHVGFNVALQLLDQQHEVRLLVRTFNDNITRLVNKGAKCFIVDLSDQQTFAEHLQGADVVFHLAAENTTSTLHSERIINNTFGITKSVLDASIHSQIKVIVYTSSVVVLGRSKDKLRLINEDDLVTDPESPYVKGKLLAEEYCRKISSSSSADIRIVYPSWVMGEGDSNGTPPHSIIGKFIENGQSFYFNGGISIANVKNVAAAHINAWLLGKSSGRYIVAGPNITFKEFYSFLAMKTHRKSPVLKIPKFVIYTGSVILKFLLGSKNPVDSAYVKSVVDRYSWYDSSRAIREIGYIPGNASSILEEGILQARKLRLQTHKVFDQHTTAAVRTYDHSDTLLITGFPGWLSLRMIDIMINGDAYGRNKINRKIKLLVQQNFKIPLEIPANFEIVYGDLRDKQSLNMALKGISCVYHLAGVIYPERIADFHDINYKGTVDLVDACIENKVRRILFMSTDSVCGYARHGINFSEDEPPRPYKNYGRSKFLAEDYIFSKTKAGLIDGTSLRGFWFFGPYAPPRNLGFLKMFKWKRQLVFGSGKNYRSISHIDNITDAFIHAEDKPNTFGKWYWIGEGTGQLTVDEIYLNIAEAMDRPYNPLYIPGWICECCSMVDTLAGKFGYLNATIHAAGKFHKNIAAKSEKAHGDFGYAPLAGFDQIKNEIKKIKL